ncbi:MAG: hypothetical protein WC538_20735 [Thermoanaerobaculia bacterium]|jgi:hypothetical protein
MKIKTLAVAVLTLSMAGAAFAQSSAVERGGMGGGSGAGNGAGTGTGMGNGNGPGGDGRGASFEIVVATDGTAFLVRHLEADATGQFEVVAIRTSGATGWSYKLVTLGPASLVAAGANVVAIQHGDGLASQGTPPTTPVTHTSKLTALSQASGSAIWTLAIDGNVGDVKPFANGLYLTVTKPEVDSTGAVVQGSGVKSLVAVSNDGAVLWTVRLN